MDFVLPFNQTTSGPGTSLPPLIAGVTFADSLQSPTSIGLSTLLAAIVSFLAYQIYRPPVHPKSPAFISDTIPIFGSLGFVTRQWYRSWVGTILFAC